MPVHIAFSAGLTSALFQRNSIITETRERGTRTIAYRERDEVVGLEQDCVLPLALWETKFLCVLCACVMNP